MEEMTHSKEWYENWRPPQKILHGIPTEWGWVVLYPENLCLGSYTDIAAFCLINAKYGVKIDDYVELGPYVCVLSDSSIDNKQGKIHLKKNCKIGSHSVIMPGVTIGENTIIGAFSFVNHDISDNRLAFGVPATIKR